MNRDLPEAMEEAMEERTATIGEVMTPMPHSVGIDQTLATARALMARHHVRHLPVLHEGRLRGILSSRDIEYVLSIRGVDPERVTVEDAMTQDPYAVPQEAPLDDVVLEMSQHRYGCALVVQGSRVVGIFTTTDALQLLGEVLRRAAAGEAHAVARRTRRTTDGARAHASARRRAVTRSS